MKKIIKTLLVVMVIAMVVTVLASCDLVDDLKDPCRKGHTMEAIGEKLATCTEDGYSSGVVCSVCGYAERQSFKLEAKGHDMAKATCDKPATCKTCGYTEGEALGHTWVDADCDTPKTCSACGKTEGEALGHTDADENHVCETCEAKLHVNKLVVGEDNKIVVYGDTLNLANAPIEWVELVVTEAGTYTLTGDTYAFIYAAKDLMSAPACGFLGTAVLEPGTYYICIGGTAGEFTVTVTYTAPAAE